MFENYEYDEMTKRLLSITQHTSKEFLFTLRLSTPDDKGLLSNNSDAIVPPSLQNGTSSRRDFDILLTDDGGGC